MAHLKSAKIVHSKSIFYVKNQPIFFKFFSSLKNIYLGDHFLLKEKKSNFNFKIRLLLKPGPILDGAALHQFTKIQHFP